MKLFNSFCLFSIIFSFNFAQIHSEEYRSLRMVEKPAPQFHFEGVLPILEKADGLGNIVAVWVKNQEIYWSMLNAEGKDWTIPQLVFKSDFLITDMKLASNDNGDFILSWLQSDPHHRTKLMAALLLDQSIEWKISTVTEVQGIETPVIDIKINAFDIAMNSSKKTVVVWEQNMATTVILYSDYSPKNGWSSPSQISATDQFATHPSITINESGRAVFSWLIDTSKGVKLMTYILPADGSWITPKPLATVN